MEKQCKIDLVVVDSTGKGETVVANLDFNAAMHVGQDYAEFTYEMTPTPTAKLFGVNATSIRLSASVSLTEPIDDKVV